MWLNLFLRFFGIFLFAFLYIPFNVDEAGFQIGDSFEVDTAFPMNDNSSTVGDIAADGGIGGRFTAPCKTYGKVGRTADAYPQCGVLLGILLS